MASLGYVRYFFNKEKEYNAICSGPIKNKCLAMGGTSLSVFCLSVWINACMGCASLWVNVQVGVDEHALCQSLPWKTR